MTSTIEIPPKSGTAFTVQAGQLLRIIDLDGQQVADFVCFNDRDRSEYFSQSRTRANNWNVRISTGDVLYSNLNRPMFVLLEDTVGVHDLLLPACNAYIYEHQFKVEPRNGCYENLAIALEPHGLDRATLPDPFNIFTNTVIEEGGKLAIRLPLSGPGDHLDFRAEMDCLVAVTACAEDITDCNAGICTRIGVEVT